MADPIPPLGEFAAGLNALLCADCSRFAQRARQSKTHRLSRADIARGLSGERWDTKIRGIEDPAWRPNFIETAAAVEAAWRDHPEWFPKSTLGFKVQNGHHGFVLRRFVPCDDSPEFGKIVAAWRARRSDAEFLDQWSHAPFVSVVDISPEDPAQYRIVSYSRELRDQLGEDKTGLTFAENHNPTYAKAVMEDFSAVKASGEPSCRDILWQFRAPSASLVFRNAALPCLDEGRIVSQAHWAVFRYGLIARRGNGKSD